uniref:Uncharacterized protein n=1 Tax=Xiphophorus maculatus TaxID=8083 RepID=A0A3B5QG71_XIPMA
MKCTVVFLVLSMVVMMAQPGEGIFGLLSGVVSGIGHAIHGISRLVKNRRRGVDQDVQQEVDQAVQNQQDQQQLDKRLFKHKFASTEVDLRVFSIHIENTQAALVKQ